jgi:glutathione S-transferase
LNHIRAVEEGMLLYDTPGAPNPKRVRFFIAEKGLRIPTRAVDLIGLEHRDAAFASLSPLQTVPALALDDGAVLTESVAICRYLEWLHPEPPLFGRDGREQAFVEMWQRRMEFHLFLPVALAFRHSHPRLAVLEQPQIAEVAATQRPRAVAAMRYLDAELATRPFVAGDAFTIADITASWRWTCRDRRGSRSRRSLPPLPAGARPSPPGRAPPHDRGPGDRAGRGGGGHSRLPPLHGGDAAPAACAAPGAARVADRPAADREPGARKSGQPDRHPLQRPLRRAAARLDGRRP